MTDQLGGLAADTLATRPQLAATELGPLLDTGALINDEQRRRPYYFDGRFLAARDLTQDQDYFLVRQADLGLTTGTGVVEGLQVSAAAGATSLHITAGLGVTSAGEMVVLRKDTDVDLADLPAIQRLDSAFGLAQTPHALLRNRTGIFVVVLRPVEYTANPIASYPTTIDGKRTTQDGDIVEATVVSLIPSGDSGTRGQFDQIRSQLARQIFADNASTGAPAGALPVAMVALDGGVVRWVDQYLVRREVGTERGDLLRLSNAPRATREAYLLQYDAQLQDILQVRGGRGQRFAATDYFQALPPVGRMPVAVVDSTNFTQSYFPPQVNVDLSIVPTDELMGLVEEGLQLPPIDLTLSAAELGSTSILLLIPLDRPNFTSFATTLTERPRPLRTTFTAAAKRLPFDSLGILTLPQLPIGVLQPLPTLDSLWRSALTSLGQNGFLWYVRRRNASVRLDEIGIPVPVQGT
jgi:hypothetical protein